MGNEKHSEVMEHFNFGFWNSDCGLKKRKTEHRMKNQAGF